jgi:hypothetical protein
MRLLNTLKKPTPLLNIGTDLDGLADKPGKRRFCPNATVEEGGAVVRQIIGKQ